MMSQKMNGSPLVVSVPMYLLSDKGDSIRASPPVLSMWLQTVKSIVKKSKCAGLAQQISFSAPNSCSFKKQCNKLDLTAT
jgi:hypothetical protein